MSQTDAVTTDIGEDEMTAEQLALPSSEPRYANTQYGKIRGGTVKNGVQVFLNVPYAQDVRRWEDPKPLGEGYRYSDKAYIVDGLYCAQPDRDFPQKPPKRQMIGLGSPTENPFFADIYIPSTVPLPLPSSSSTPGPNQGKKVHVFIHGGFLNFGSTSGQHYNQQFFAAETFDEIRVLLGYRVSAWGFLGSEKGGVSGNYGFKDCWAGLEWVKENISAFGGDPGRIQLSGLSGGAHVVHQLLHYAARQAPKKAPFVSAIVQSNAILSNPLLPEEKEDQFEAFAQAAGVDPSSPDALEQLRDEEKTPLERLVQAVESLDKHGVFRGVAGTDGWNAPNSMEFQASGELGRRLKEAGVEFVVLGDVRDEVAFYSIVHPCKSADDILPNLERYYSPEDSRKLLQAYPALPPNPSPAECDKLQGRILADAQVHLPVRFLAKDLVKGGLAVVRYTVEYVVKALGTNGTVIHGSDLMLHHYKRSILSQEEANIALRLHKALEDASSRLEETGVSDQKDEETVLKLSSDGKVGWEKDGRWAELRSVEAALRS